ncbi:MAG TPA: fumarylacetoacetate hydrolase family protein [Clostridia bacterium]|nr:fumarylacetoacetate hydrolase family protein [Clostridia bacterium]
MNLCRFQDRAGQVRIGVLEDSTTVCDLTPAGLKEMQPVLESVSPVEEIQKLLHPQLPRIACSEVRLCAPVEHQEIWAAGVTYLRSKAARMEESDFSATAYDRVYAAERPELFFKSLPEKVVAQGEPVGIRRDATWSVPEPEFALVINSSGRIVGYTIGNDMSSRDIEGENLLYLPQAKIYDRSCALGPCITLGVPEAAAREWAIRLHIHRQNQTVFSGETSVGQIKRSFTNLAGFLFRCQQLPHGAILLTGTGVVPPETFSLQAEDIVEIEITGIGRLRNPVIVV